MTKAQTMHLLTHPRDAEALDLLKKQGKPATSPEWFGNRPDFTTEERAQIIKRLRQNGFIEKAGSVKKKRDDVWSGFLWLNCWKVV